MFDIARKFLVSLQRFDLALLLSPCNAAIMDVEVDRGFFSEVVTQAIVDAPQPVDEALQKLPPEDRKRISEAIATAYPHHRAPEDIVVHTKATAEIDDCVKLLAELLIHREMMVSVGTGGERIQDVNDYYRAREARIRQTLPPDIEYENPHADLWHWYQYYRENLQQYKDRRFYIRQIFGPAINTVSTRSSFALQPREPTGWERVDRALSKAKSQLQAASAEEDFQAIGLMCREVIISLAQAVYDPSIHTSLDGVKPSATDANRMLEAYISHTFPGESFKEVRSHARAALSLALNLQHRRTATRQLAALCVEGTASTTAIISIIARSPI